MGRYNKFQKEYLLNILFSVLCIFMLYIVYIAIYNYKYNNNINNTIYTNIIYKDINEYYNDNEYIYSNIPNIITSNIVTYDNLPNISNITKYVGDKYITVFPSIFNFPFKNYIGKFKFYLNNSMSELPVFTLDNVRLLITNFNTNKNYLYYVVLNKLDKLNNQNQFDKSNNQNEFDKSNNQDVYDLFIMDFENGNMKNIRSNSDFKGTNIHLNEYNQIVYKTIKYFDVIPKNNITLNGVIDANEQNLLNIIANPNGKYNIVFEQYIDLQLNNYKNIIDKTNDGLYMNYNFVLPSES